MSLPLMLKALPEKVQSVEPGFARWSAPGAVEGMIDLVTAATTSLVEPSGPNAVARNQPWPLGLAPFGSATTVYVKPGSAVNVCVLGDQIAPHWFTTSFWKFSTPMPAARFATCTAWRIADSATKWICVVRR